MILTIKACDPIEADITRINRQTANFAEYEFHSLMKFA